MTGLSFVSDTFSQMFIANVVFPIEGLAAIIIKSEAVDRLSSCSRPRSRYQLQ